MALIKSCNLLGFVLLTLIVAGCQSTDNVSPLLNAEPEPGGMVTRTPQTLRLYFSQLPNVESSAVTLHSSSGRELNLRGMHTMGANDLMMEIYDQVPDGEYTVNWTAVLEGDPAHYNGSYSFTVRAN